MLRNSVGVRERLCTRDKKKLWADVKAFVFTTVGKQGQFTPA